jgi:hypothetical protein
MQCHDVQNQLVNCLYGEITADRREAVMAHVARCGGCGETWNALQDGRRMLDRLGQPEECPAIDVQRLFHTAANRAQRQRRGWKRLAAACATAAAVLLVVLVAGLRVKVSPGQAVVAWGARAEPVHDDESPADDQRIAELADADTVRDGRTAAQERRIVELAQRLQTVDELARLATAELLAVDKRHQRELARLQTALARSERHTQTVLNELREQSDLRWKLTVHELSQRPALSAVSVVDTAVPVR